MPKTPSPRAKVFLTSATSAGNLAVLGGGSAVSLGMILAQVGGGAVAGGLSLAVSVSAYVAMVAWDLINPKFIEKTLGPPAKRAGVPEDADAPEVDPAEVQAADVRRLYEAVLASQESLRRQLTSGGPLAGDSFAEIHARGALLVAEAGVLARRSNTLVSYLEAEPAAALEAQIASLEEKARRTRDEKAAEGYRQAAATRRQQLETRAQIEGLCDRIRAQLSVIETALDDIRAKLVKVKAHDSADAHRVGASVSAQLLSLKSDVAGLETAIAETMHEIGG